MPELPEVETTLRGIEPHILKKRVLSVTLRHTQLRWPIPQNLDALLKHKTLKTLERRGKYLLLGFSNGTLLCHLGMSGSLRITTQQDPVKKHDHADILMSGNTILRYHDPRRFGALLWTELPPEEHTLLAHLGPEPLDDAFTSGYLYQRSRKRSQAIKSWIMDSKVVVGVGNIYANEALFNSGIHPCKAAGKLSKKNSDTLTNEIKKVLASAIQRGGTTLKDFVGGDGKPGYFAQELNVYGRGGAPCIQCKKALTEKRIAQRSTVYCTVCQT